VLVGCGVYRQQAAPGAGAPAPAPAARAACPAPRLVAA
jgi:hypothetical protein